MTIQTSIDGFRAVAERSKQLAGIDDAIYDSGKEHKVEPVNPTTATVTVYRVVSGLRVPFTATARWKEYKPADKQDFMWRKMPYLMLAKCAEALALRKAFPLDLSGIRTDEEMMQAGPVDVIPQEVKKTEKNTPTANVKPEKEKKAQNEAVEGEIIENKESPEYFCSACGDILTKQENDFSTRMYGKPLCREDQKGQDRIN